MRAMLPEHLWPLVEPYGLRRDIAPKTPPPKVSTHD
jgi:hypothetical protein